MSDLLGLEISEGALVNMLKDSRLAFARQTSQIRARLLCGTARTFLLTRQMLKHLKQMAYQ
jgi:hypothetical protein